MTASNSLPFMEKACVRRTGWVCPPPYRSKPSSPPPAYPYPGREPRLPFHEKSANSAPRLSYRHTPTGNGRVGQVEALGRQRLHVGRVELVPEPSAVRFARLRGNLIACRFLLAAVLLAQLADVLTTQIALGRGFVETNGVLLSLAHGSEVGAVALKLVAIVAVLTLALIRLPARRARVAVVLALALSAIGPIANVAHVVGLIVGVLAGFVSAWWNGFGQREPQG